MLVQPYLFFDGRCEEALAFYRSAIDAKVTNLVRWSESPDPECRPANADKLIMHARLVIGDTTVFASDGCPQSRSAFGGFSLSLTADSDAEAKHLFTALSDGGNVVAPLGKTFFASSFGVLVDRFGVSWMVIAGAQ